MEEKNKWKWELRPVVFASQDRFSNITPSPISGLVHELYLISIEIKCMLLSKSRVCDLQTPVSEQSGKTMCTDLQHQREECPAVWL